ncbi:MAG: hypothetical protein R2734_14765 [Nocardioides sp.]
MAALGLGAMERFPFVEPPDRRHVAAGTQLLEELGARSRDATWRSLLDRRARLTRVGRRLARLPIDPRLGRMIGCERLGCVREVVVIAAALSLQDPRASDRRSCRPRPTRRAASAMTPPTSSPG